MENVKLWLINGYGPQESDDSASFYARLDLEIKRAKYEGAMVMIEMDSNAKLGMDIIPNDPHIQSKNGRILQSVIEENDLVVVNASGITTGLITRYRKTVNSEEKRILDYFIVCRSLF